jgi:hypothetical protein
LGALLVEQYHEQNKSIAAAKRQKSDSKKIDVCYSIIIYAGHVLL